MLRPGGGASRLTYRRLHDLLEYLPAESRTKTAQRDMLDPLELAALADGDVARGWGEHGRVHELLCMIGEAVDRVGYYVLAANSEHKPKEPPRWRRPGVLSADEQARAIDPASLAVREQLEQERAERAQRRAAKVAARKAAEQAANTT